MHGRDISSGAPLLRTQRCRLLRPALRTPRVLPDARADETEHPPRDTPAGAHGWRTADRAARAAMGIRGMIETRGPQPIATVRSLSFVRRMFAEGPRLGYNHGEVLPARFDALTGAAA